MPVYETSIEICYTLIIEEEVKWIGSNNLFGMSSNPSNCSLWLFDSNVGLGNFYILTSFVWSG